MKKSDKFWCWWMSRYLYFVREFADRDTGAACYVFKDICDAHFTLTDSQMSKLERVRQ